MKILQSEIFAGTHVVADAGADGEWVFEVGSVDVGA
jgi:hypothetical protein